jgi:aspartyl protease/PDZ domain-containing protein
MLRPRNDLRHERRARMIGNRLRGFALLILIGISGARVEPSFAQGTKLPDAREAVDRHLEAVGGRAAFEAARTAHLWVTLTAFGLTGRTEVWLESPDKRATEVVLGPFTLKDGCDGARAWRTDPGGQLIVLDGKDLEEAKASAWFENDRWLAPDFGGGSVTVVGPEEDGRGKYLVLDVAPPVGRVRRVYLDRSTWLVDRYESKRDQATVTVRLSDYRVVEGRKLAFRSVQQVAGMPANDATVYVDSMRVNETIPPERWAPPAGKPSALRYLKTEGTARLPFEYSARHVWLKASVNGGPPADFLYDTGASLTVIDSAYAAGIGLKTEGRIQGEGAGATGSGTFARVGSLEVASPDSDGVELDNLEAAVIDLNHILAPYFWRDVAGVIGFDFIVRFVNEIDYDRRVLVLHDPAKFEYHGAGAAIPMTLAGHAPVAKLTLDSEVDGDFRIDVGSGSTVDLHAPFVRRYSLDKDMPPGVDVVSGGFGGTFQSRVTRAKSLAIGPYTWQKPLVSLSGAEGGAFSSEDYAGNVGNQLLERFKVTLDYERRVLHLEPGAQFKQPDSFSRSGLQLERSGDVVRAAQVVAGSPAAKAKIRPGDTIVELAGRPIGEYTVDGATALLDHGKAGKKVKLVIEQDGKRRKLKLKLRDFV